MKTVLKTISAILNFLNYACAAAAVLSFIFKIDAGTIIPFEGFSKTASLFLNALIFQLILAAAQIMTLLIAKDYAAKKSVVFPTVYMIVPALVGIIGCVYAMSLGSSADKITVFACCAAFIVISVITVFCGSKVFQLFERENKNEKQ